MARIGMQLYGLEVHATFSNATLNISQPCLSRNFFYWVPQKKGPQYYGFFLEAMYTHITELIF